MLGDIKRMSKSLFCASNARRAARALLLVSASVSVLAVSPAIAQDAQAQKSDATVLAPLEVDAQAVKHDDLPQPYAGGQVARGGRIGVLGNQDIMDVPFSVTSYTEQTIRNQQAQTVADILANDPSVRSGFGFGNSGEEFMIRGFPLSSADISIDGVYGITPRQIVGLEMFERVEVLKGASAFLNGTAVSGGALGGSINLVPKRAGDEPFTRVTGTYGMDSQFGGHVDTGMRFGPNKAFGIRINVAGRDGDTAIDDQKEWSALGAVALDYRGERVRLSLDAASQKIKIDKARDVVYIDAGLTQVPSAPDANTNYAPDWAYTALRDTFALLQGEFDITENLTAYAAFGARDMREDGDYGAPTVAAAATTLSRLTVPREDTNYSGQLGLRAKFNTGPLEHAINTGLSALTQDNHNAWTFGFAGTTDIYNPVDLAYPATTFSAGNFDDLPLVSSTKLSSAYLSDTMTYANVHLTLGLRKQRINIKGYDTASGLLTSAYDETAVTPVVGLAVNVTDQLSLYANRIEGLSQGPVAPGPLLVANPGAVFAPYKSKQYEVGGKLDFGTLGFGAAVFQTEQPSSIIDPVTKIFSVDGEQRNRGVELTTFGEPIEGVRLLGGVTYVKAELTTTAAGLNDGNQAAGVPKYLANLGAEWDLPFVPGLTVSARALYTASQYVNPQNTQEIPSWTRFDLGARYRLVVQSRPIDLNLQVENVTNKGYWASANSAGFVSQGRPLTARLSVSTEF